ncbi:L,D-transpeptidase family protein [Streptomyces sp. NPDC051976]|uniref:L,D-transpeptidase family protein n=1 Tax=Streptomyces sp. NPDC051976 TaxID=3154947 RepID=UPI00342441FC
MSARPPHLSASVLAPVLVMAAIGALTGCGPALGASAQNQVAAPAVTVVPPRPSPTLVVASPALPSRLPGLGAKTLAQVPAGSRQVVVVTGRGVDSALSSVVVYQRTATGWRAGAPWPARNALRGWSRDHHAGDLRSPVGVFTLSDAGGRLADPGTRLTYDHSPRGFSIAGTGFDGESLAGAFDYVVAIDYNRGRGLSPLDWTRPLGDGKGGGIWFHVDHGGPTHGCVSLSLAHMKQLLDTLDPARHPVVVMGDAASLSR